MNNKEAAKALLEGKTLNRKGTKFHYNFDKELLCIKSTSGDYVTLDDFPETTEWEEVKEPYRETQYIKYVTKWNILPSYVPAGKYKVIIEEIE